MTHSIKLAAILVVVALLPGCSSLLSQKTAKLAPTGLDKAKGETVTLPAQLRTVTLKTSAAAFLSCAEPGPDVALSDTFKLITAVTSERASSVAGAASAPDTAERKGSLSNDLQSSTTALELAGRTQTVLLAREFLFRTCEAAANGWLDKTDVKDAHKGTLAQIAGMVAADTKKAETAGALAVTSAAIRLDAKVLLNTSSAIRDATQSACVKEFEECLAKPGMDGKARGVCRATFSDCMK